MHQGFKNFDVDCIRKPIVFAILFYFFHGKIKKVLHDKSFSVLSNCALTNKTGEL